MATFCPPNLQFLRGVLNPRQDGSKGTAALLAHGLLLPPGAAEMRMKDWACAELSWCLACAGSLGQLGVQRWGVAHVTRGRGCQPLQSANGPQLPPSHCHAVYEIQRPAISTFTGQPAGCFRTSFRLPVCLQPSASGGCRRADVPLTPSLPPSRPSSTSQN